MLRLNEKVLKSTVWDFQKDSVLLDEIINL